MGLFSKKIPQDDISRVEMVTTVGNGFYAWNGNLYQSDVIRSCIRPKAKAIGKLTAKHIRRGTDGVKVNPEPYMRFLLEEPNPYMTGQVFQEKMTTQLELNNNAFAIIIKDDFGYPIEIYPIPCTSAETKYQENGELFLKFTFRNGKIKTFDYKNIIHLRKDFNEDDIFGTSPVKTLEPLMEIINTTDQGIIYAVKNSNIIKWLLKFKMKLQPEDLNKQIEDFRKNFLSIDSKTGGAIASDSSYDVEQVEQNSYVPNALQMDRTTMRLYNFFNTNVKIIQSNSSEDDWNAYYEGVIEPDAMQWSGEYTRKLFSRKQRGFGNTIIFEASNLSHASMKTKLGLVAMVDRGALTPNEWRDVLNIAPIEGGDKPIRRLDTALAEGGEDDGKD